MKPIIGIIDYGLGNQASIYHTLRDLNYHARITSDQSVLSQSDLLLLPGVGAFSCAMESLVQRNLEDYLKNEAKKGRAILGICLGMQLLTESSSEYGVTKGLGLVPGSCVSFEDGIPHIGWNEVVELSSENKWIDAKQNNFYFNHSYYYEGPEKYKLAQSFFTQDFASIIRNENVVGIQFHPEKSQIAGRFLLKRIIEDLRA